MLNFLKKNLVKIILAIIFAVVGVAILNHVSKPKPYFYIDKTVQVIEFEGENAYFTFEGDSKTYITYEWCGVDFEPLRQLNPGDVVNVKLEDTDFKSTYTIIYVLKHGEDVLIDVTDYYYKNDLVVHTIFVLVPFSISFVLILFTLVQLKKSINTADRFINQMPQWMLVFFILGLSAGTIFSIEFLVFSILGIVPPRNIPFISIGLLFVVICLLGIIVYKRGYFSFIDGTYKYVDLFKTRQVKINEISKVYLKSNPNMKFYVVGRENAIILKLPMERVIFKDNLFVSSLEKNNIKIETAFIDTSIRKDDLMSETNQIKALSFFDKKEYALAYPMYKSFFEKRQNNFFRYHLMISSIYCGDIEKAQILYKELENRINSLNDKTLLLSIYLMKYYYAFALAENNRINEANELFNELNEILSNNNISKDIKPTVEMMDNLGNIITKS